MLVTTLILLTALQICCAQFTVQPESVVQAEGLEAVFECLYPGALTHNWGINGNFPADDQFPPDVTRIPPSVDSPARLIIPATPQYNTVVQCEVVVREGGVLMSVLSENATLEVQGPLSSVTNLHFLLEQSSSTTITISWEAPFSLNLTTAEPDIQYCVDVVTGGGDDHLQSVCDITDTHYTFTASDPDQLFNFTVTPRSNVEGSLNGTTSQPVRGSLVQAPILINHNLIKLKLNGGSDSIIFDVIFPVEALGRYPGKFPASYRVDLSTNVSEDIQYSCLATSSRIQEKVIVAANCTPNIPMHQLFNVTLITVNSVGEMDSEPVLLSTHYVQKINASNFVEEKQLAITCFYLKDFSSPGSLVILLSGSQTFYRVASRNDSESITTVFVEGIQFDEAPMVAVYDFEGEKRLPEGKPARYQTITNATTYNPASSNLVPSSPSQSLLLLEYNVTYSNEEKICLSCSFSAGELTGCVGVIHSARLEDPTLTVLTVERSGATNCTNVFPVNYSYTVFGLTLKGLVELPAGPSEMNPSTPSAASTVKIVMSIVLSAVALLFIIFLLVYFLYWRKAKSSKSFHCSSQSDSHLENAYVSSNTQGNVHNLDSGRVYVDPGLEVYAESAIGVQNDSPREISSFTEPAGAQSFDREYENVQHNLKMNTESFELPPSFEVATEQSHVSESMVRLTENLESTAKNLTLPQIVLHGGKSSLSIASVEEPSEQVPSTEPSSSGMTSEILAYTLAHPQENSSPPSNSFVAQEPAYAVTKQILVKEVITSSDPPPDNTQTEHQYSEISGTVNQESGGHYAHVNIKSHHNDKPSMDPTKVQYASIDNMKLVSARSSEDIQELIGGNPVPPPLPPPPPAPETVLSELHSIAEKWKELGEALGVPECMLKNISMEGSDQVRLHDMIQYYLQSPHSWEEIVRALEKIGEIEPADKIVRTKRLEVSLPTTPQTLHPSLPPKQHQHDAQPCDNEAEELDEFKSEADSNLSHSSPQENLNEKGDSNRKNYESTKPAYRIKESNRFLSNIFWREYGNIKKPEIKNEQDWSTPEDTPYQMTMIHSLGVFERFNVPMNHKIRALGYLNSDHYTSTRDLYQKRMESADELQSEANQDVYQRRMSAHCDEGEAIEQQQQGYQGQQTPEAMLAQTVSSDNQSTHILAFSDTVDTTTVMKHWRKKAQGVCYQKGKTDSCMVVGTLEMFDPASCKQMKVTPPSPESVKSCWNYSTISTYPKFIVDTTLLKLGGNEGSSIPGMETTLAFCDQPSGLKNAKQNKEKNRSLSCCFFSWLVGTFHPPEHCSSSKGIQLREHGCIFQPEDVYDGKELLDGRDGLVCDRRLLLSDIPRIEVLVKISFIFSTNHHYHSQLELSGSDQTKTRSYIYRPQAC